MTWLARSFVYRRVESLIHRLDPRVRLLISTEFFALSLWSDRVWEVALTSLAVLVLCVLSKILRRMARTAMFASSFAAVIFALNFIFGYTIYESTVIALRFVSVVMSSSFFFLTTSPDELEHVMKWFRVPRDIVFAFVTAVRFVPVLMLDAIQIMDSQKSRGLEVEKGNPISRVRRMAPILIPLIVSAVVRSGELAEAMESRAYGSTKKTTTLYVLHIQGIDKAVSIVSIILFSAVLYLFLLPSLFEALI